MSDSESDSDEWSDADYFDDLGALDLVNLDENERQQLEHFINDRESSGDEDDERYVAPENFEWTDEFSVRCRLPFSEKPGPVRVLDSSASVLNYFQIFYTDEIFNHVVECTNRNANKKRTEDANNNKGVWQDVTLEEIKLYYGVLIMIDIIKLDRDDHSWKEDERYFMLGTKISDIISRDRFMQIKRYLNFTEEGFPEQCNDKLFKVRYMLDKIRNAFKSEYIPHEEISVDESMVPFKGRLSFKQYMKDKPCKFGIKFWMLADATSAYCWNFDVYVGKYGTEIDRTFGLSGRVVIDLLHGLENKGYCVFTDNFYTSPTLAHYLTTIGTCLCGTIRPNRRGFPQDLIKSIAEARKLPRGYHDWRQCDGMIATCWKDKKMVYFLSTCHVPEKENLTAKRHNKDGTIVEFPDVPSGAAYSKYMGAVDRNDQVTKLNKSKKAMRWYRKIERKLLELSIYNAYVLEGSVIKHKQPGKRKRELLGFKLDLAHELIGQVRIRKRTGRSRSATSDQLLRLDGKNHLPAVGEGKDHVCVVCNEKHMKYKERNPDVSYSENPFKRCKTTIKCEKCDKYLCCNTKNMCFSTLPC